MGARYIAVWALVVGGDDGLLQELKHSACRHSVEASLSRPLPRALSLLPLEGGEEEGMSLVDYRRLIVVRIDRLIVVRID